MRKQRVSENPALRSLRLDGPKSPISSSTDLSPHWSSGRSSDTGSTHIAHTGNTHTGGFVERKLPNRDSSASNPHPIKQLNSLPASATISNPHHSFLAGSKDDNRSVTDATSFSSAETATDNKSGLSQAPSISGTTMHGGMSFRSQATIFPVGDNTEKEATQIEANRQHLEMSGTATSPTRSASEAVTLTSLSSLHSSSPGLPALGLRKRSLGDIRSTRSETNVGEAQDSSFKPTLRVQTRSDSSEVGTGKPPLWTRPLSNFFHRLSHPNPHSGQGQSSPISPDSPRPPTKPVGSSIAFPLLANPPQVPQIRPLSPVSSTSLGFLERETSSGPLGAQPNSSSIHESSPGLPLSPKETRDQGALMRKTEESTSSTYGQSSSSPSTPDRGTDSLMSGSVRSSSLDGSDFRQSISFSGTFENEKMTGDATSVPRFRLPTKSSDENFGSSGSSPVSVDASETIDSALLSAVAWTSSAPAKSAPTSTEKSIRMAVGDDLIVHKRSMDDAASAQTIPPSTIGVVEFNASTDTEGLEDSADAVSNVPIADDPGPQRHLDDNHLDFPTVPTLRSESSSSFDVPLRIRYSDSHRSPLQTFEEERATLAMIELDRPVGLTEYADTGPDGDDEEAGEPEPGQSCDAMVFAKISAGKAIDEEKRLEEESNDDNASLAGIYDYPDNPYESLSAPFGPWRELPQHPIEALGPSYNPAGVLRQARKRFVTDLKTTKQSYRISSIKSTFSMIHKFKHNFAVRKFDEKSKDKLNKYKAIRKGDWVRYKALHAATLLAAEVHVYALHPFPDYATFLQYFSTAVRREQTAEGGRLDHRKGVYNG
ncbi:hypothetical protein M427DRAFT_312553 [Gonapodya prolifera JEL478]|uniref:Uncharacterized protein n=1 Tax=Gonapodya prolifera (strain JEL478) TaxID=1344416 RepID=A0A139AWN2_GONPJ|nr:hypothetical protein M427DRAFT_312553 [Gonapodya prolifera JEL478]|eukprot:KXS21151.1 hypothetical protein M427DRAFT_312553 [Gonapodya prolifera JEL478]